MWVTRKKQKILIQIWNCIPKMYNTNIEELSFDYPKHSMDIIPHSRFLERREFLCVGSAAHIQATTLLLVRRHKHYVIYRHINYFPFFGNFAAI